MAMTITTVYALDMAKFVYVQLYAPSTGAPMPPTLRIRADRIEKTKEGTMVLKLGTEQVGEFSTAVQGWWVQDES